MFPQLTLLEAVDIATQHLLTHIMTLEPETDTLHRHQLFVNSLFRLTSMEFQIGLIFWHQKNIFSSIMIFWYQTSVSDIRGSISDIRKYVNFRSHLGWGAVSYSSLSITQVEMYSSSYLIKCWFPLLNFYLNLTRKQKFTIIMDFCQVKLSRNEGI